ncbi:hypothetical protein ACFEMC_02485 [Kineococcus sp. DHX-1]|uniref:hypothetical protein n=1 Tax=Kineococcus sp. DHX-1 TaxID=3349638 RepID=UPI0036D36C5B
MTLLAPEPRPATTPAPEADTVLGTGLDTTSATVLTWWDRLPRGRREQLLSLAPDEVLPRSVAAELQRLGVDCPLTLVAEDLRQVRRALPPQALLELIERERSR